MAKGRMIIKDISYDSRIWGMSDRAIMLFPYCLPHLEADGTLPRVARSIRLMCFPEARVSDGDTEGVILEWLATRTPSEEPICKEQGRRLFFTDFEQSNENLDFLRKRRQRELAKVSQTVQDSPKCPVEVKGSEVKGSEVKGSEEKRTTVRTKNIFTPPTLEAVQAYCTERNNTVVAQLFLDYYAARGWRYKAGQPMKDWQAAVRTWEKNSGFNRGAGKGGAGSPVRTQGAPGKYAELEREP